MQRLTALIFPLVASVIRLGPAVAQTGIDGRKPPIIDMHLHAFHVDDEKPPAVNPVTGQPSAARTSAELCDSSLAMLERYNIVKAVVSGPPEMVGQWREAAPDRIMSARSWTRRTRYLTWRDYAPRYRRVACMF